MKIPTERRAWSTLVAAMLSAAPFALDAQVSPQVPTPAGAPNARLLPEVGLRLGAGQTDNLGRDASEVRSDVQLFGIDVNASSTGARFEGRVVSDLELRNYGTDVVVDDDEVVGALDGSLDVGIVPDRFVWTFQQNFGQMTTNPLAPAGPNNRENTSIFSTGPQITLPLGGRNSLEGEARFSERRYETSESLNGQFESLRLGFVHALNSVTRVGVHFDNEESDYDIDSATYEFRIVSVSYEKDFASGGVALSAGRGEIGQAGSTESTSVAQFRWSRTFGQRSRWSFWAQRELTDAGEVFRRTGMRSAGGDVLSALTGVIGNDDRVRNVVLTSDPLRRSGVGARFDLEGRATMFGVSLSTTEDNFAQDDAFDNDADTVEVFVQRTFGRRWEGEVALTRWNQQFADGALDNEDRAARLSLTRQLAQALSLTLTGGRTTRRAGLDPYDENIYLVSLGYSFARR